MKLLSSISQKAKMILSIKKLTLLIVSTLFLYTGSLQAQDGEALFKQKCAACHTIGKGKLVGPDLHGITDIRSEAWIHNFIKSSTAVIQSGDKDAVAIYNEFNKMTMPDHDIPDADIAGIIAYIKDMSSQAVPQAAGTQPTNASDKATPEEIMLGKHLFEGSTRFTNKGAACISCHNVMSDRVIPGGLLAKDLTTAHSRLGGDAGISGILNAPPFPAMTEAYKGKQLTENEITALTAFLNIVDKESITKGVVAKSPFLNPMLIWGGLGFLVWVGLVFLIWRNRKSKMTKRKIYERQIKTA